MSKATTPSADGPNGRPTTAGFSLDPRNPLHQLFRDRMEKGRDLKIVVTAENAATGTGKTTLAFFLAHQWQQYYCSEDWTAERNATLSADKFLELYKELPRGSCLIMDEAEDLDARRSMAKKNVEFSHAWMKMRVRQIVSILTLPSTSALDKRLEELADVWIEVNRRGKATVHSIAVNSYGKNVMTPKTHTMTWPNVADHPEMEALTQLKQDHIDRGMKHEQEQTQDPEDAKQETKAETAKRLRKQGLTVSDIAEAVDMSTGWVSNQTKEVVN